MAYIITENCTGCTACMKRCPTDAITGERYYSRTWMQAEWKHLFSKVCRTGKARPAVP